MACGGWCDREVLRQRLQAEGVLGLEGLVELVVPVLPPGLRVIRVRAARDDLAGKKESQDPFNLIFRSDRS